jgi:hypothetical protein
MNGQLSLFEPKPTTNGTRVAATRGGSLGHGPKGLLRALLRQGLDESALEAAAALIVQMDDEPIGDE